MQLALTEEETAFREEMRTFFTTKIPQELRDTIARGDTWARRASSSPSGS